MDLANCRRCNKLFVKDVRDICPDCIRQEEEDLRIVQRHLRKYPKATLFEIAEATGVEEDQILALLRAKHLEIKGSSPIEWPCENCGAPIKSGTLCNRCYTDLALGVEQASGTLKNKMDEETWKKEWATTNMSKFRK